MPINRRTFLATGGAAASGAFVSRLPSFAFGSDTSEFEWKTADLVFKFNVSTEKLRQKRLLPADYSLTLDDTSSGVEVALQCSGENSPDQGKKSGVGQPGADQASFNMVTGMLCRIHQIGRLDLLSAEASKQVAEGIRVYKNLVRQHIPAAVPFYPLGLPNVTDAQAPIALGMRSSGQTFLATWRIDGPAIVKIPWSSKNARLLYPTDLGIKITLVEGALNVEFPRTRLACVITDRVIS